MFCRSETSDWSTNHRRQKIYERKQKVLHAISKSKTHVLVCSNVENDGYEFARDEEDKVRFSESALRKYWPNWVVEMNEAHMIMCACEICQIMNDAHVALLAKHGNMIKRDEARLEELTGSMYTIRCPKKGQID